MAGHPRCDSCDQCRPCVGARWRNAADELDGPDMCHVCWDDVDCDECAELEEARVRDLATELFEALKALVMRCDGADGVRADGSNIDTRAAHAVIAKAEGRA